MTLRLNHVTLIVGELQRSLRFYRLLGLVPIVHAPPRYARFVFPGGDSTILRLTPFSADIFSIAGRILSAISWLSMRRSSFGSRFARTWATEPPRRRK